ncbi:MAG: amino acid adenylation domain-containing protein [Thainema sp.]
MTDFYQPWPQLTQHGQTWVELLHLRSQTQPDQIAFTFLQDGEVEAARWSYWELDQRSRAIAAQLQSLNLSGQRALLLYPAGLNYIAAFLGCLYAGVIAVPAYPPQNARKTPRIQAIAQDAEAAIALTTEAMLPRLQTLMGQVVRAQPLQWLATDALNQALADQWQMPEINGDTLAFLQYTSGSTGSPKGVMLNHRNLLHNAAATYQLMEHSPASCFISWLPLYHDMGLIGGILQPLYGGFPCVLMSPVSFLQRPYRWLKAISDYRATTSGAPNFAYDLCVDKITPEQRQTLDLSRWQVAFNGAEPIRAATLKRFTEAFAACGFHPEAHYPCYGLAEGTLMVSGSHVTQVPVIQSFQATDLAQKQAISALSVKPNQPRQTLVSSGHSLPDQQIAIADPDTLTRCSDQEIGEIWVSSPSVGQGYWQNPQATAETFRAYLKDSGDGPFLRTGDLGFLHNGELFVTGRLKDLIILRGRNLYPQDLEQTAETSHPALRISGSAAFTVTIEGEERLVIVQELEFRQKPDLDEVTTAIRQTVTETHDVEVYAVALIKPGSIPKTTSGKIQRRACRQAYLAEQLSLVKHSVLAAQTATVANSTAGPLHLSAAQLRNASSHERSGLLAAYLQHQIAQSLQCFPDQVQPQQPLTSLGLDSLRVMTLKGQLETDLGVDIAIADFFDGITPERLAQQILDQFANQHPDLALAQLASTADATQLTPSQTQIFFLQKLQPQSPAYNIAIALDCQGELNVDALRQSLQILVERHPALRSQVSLQGGQPTLTTFPTVDLPWTEVDLRDWEADRQVAEIEQLTSAITRQPFDLSQHPLFRLLLCRLHDTHYRLLLVVHHLIFDGSSAKILFRELTAQYRACVTDPARVFKPDQGFWRQPSAPQIWTQQLAYWRQQLAGELPILQLPTDYPRPAVQTFHGARERFTLPLSLLNSLKTLAHQEQATLFMLLLAAFKTWLYRYTGQTDLLVGSALAQRPQPSLAASIGCSVNTLVFRTHPSAQVSFRNFLKQVRRVALDAYSHAAVPFQTLVETLQPQRDPSYSPLVQVMLDLQQLPTRLDWPNLTVDLAEVETGTAKFDLTLSLIETEQGIQGHWEYNTDLFAPETIRRMMQHFQQLLAGIVADPDQPLATLPLLTAPERQQILVDWNQTAAPIPDGAFHQLFEDQVERTPDAIALRYMDQQLTYRELNQQANQLAHYLQSMGVTSEQLVGVCLPRTPRLLVSLLAILKAGGAYVPLDPSYPPERLAFMMQDSQLDVLLTQSETWAQLELTSDQTPPNRVELDTQTIAIAQQPTTNLGHTVTLDQLAYVIYTSGSTGKPKGVMIEQRGLVNYLTWCQQAYPLQAGQGSPVHSSISFDMTITSLFSPLLAGQTVELLPEAWGLEALATGLRRRSNFSLVKITPAQLELLSHQLAADELSERTHAFIIGGENLSAEQVNIWRDRAPHTQLVNEYGPTETVVGCCVHTVQPGDPRSGSIPIGRPIINTQLYILDDQLQPVPIGVVGELYIGGMGVARGYLNRPDLTRERFIPNPFANPPTHTFNSSTIHPPIHPSTHLLPHSSALSTQRSPSNTHASHLTPHTSRLYKTGDLARYRSDGTIEFLGRIDHQVKIRGYRVELGEIEAALTQHPAVREAVVIARTDQPEQHRLVAYLVGVSSSKREGTDRPSIQIAELRNWLRRQLPDYMVPAAFVILDQFPLTVNGKVDRQALPAPSTDRPELGNTYIAPKAELERAIADIWQSVLNLDRVGLHDNFFDLGGHSLLLVQVQSQLQTQLNREVSLVDLFRYPTIHAIAAYLDQPAESLVATAQAQAERQKAALQRRRLQRQGGRHD